MKFQDTTGRIPYSLVYTAHFFSRWGISKVGVRLLYAYNIITDKSPEKDVCRPGRTVVPRPYLYTQHNTTRAPGGLTLT